MNKIRKIPTIVGILFLLITLIVGVYLTSQATFFSPKASSSCSPASIQITNLTYKSFDISFITSKSCQVITDINGVVYTDIRNLSDSFTHYFQIDNLNPQTTYQYKFLAEGQEYTNQEYQISTFTKPSQTQPDTPLSWGKVFNPNLEPASGAIVYLNIPNAYPLSAFVTSQGYWNIPLSYCYDIEGKSWFTPPLNTPEEIVAMSVDGQMTLLTGNTSSNNPVPDIILGQDHFQPTTTPVEFTRLSPDQNSDSSSSDLSLTNPQEGESITSTKPQFFGLGPPGAQIELELNSDSQQIGNVTISDDGSWNWTPSNNIEAGDHTIKLKYTDPQTGILKAITRNFTVLAQDSQDVPAFTASESATTATPTTAPTIKPTLVPTKSISLPTPTPQLPVSGNTLPTSLIIFMSLLIIAISAIFI
jgi:Big-like domain-containing protein